MLKRKKVTYHNATTGQFVSKKFAGENPDTTMALTSCNLREELAGFYNYLNLHPGISRDEAVDAFMEKLVVVKKGGGLGELGYSFEGGV